MAYLRGELGAGKTTLAQGFLRACGIDGAVRSPTYMVLQVYPLERQTVVHLDLYRLRGPEELEPLGLTEWAFPGCLWLIEWPQRGAGGLPPADLVVDLTLTAAGHEAQLSAGSALGRAWLRRLGEGPAAHCS